MFVYGSYLDGLPRVLLEAQQRKIPVVTTHNCGCKEAAKYCMFANNPQDMAKKTMKLLKKPNDVDKCYKYVNETFDKNKMVKGYYDIICGNSNL